MKKLTTQIELLKDSYSEIKKLQHALVEAILVCEKAKEAVSEKVKENDSIQQELKLITSQINIKEIEKKEVISQMYHQGLAAGEVYARRELGKDLPKHEEQKRISDNDKSWDHAIQLRLECESLRNELVAKAHALNQSKKKQESLQKAENQAKQVLEVINSQLIDRSQVFDNHWCLLFTGSADESKKAHNSKFIRASDCSSRSLGGSRRVESMHRSNSSPVFTRHSSKLRF